MAKYSYAKRFSYAPQIVAQCLTLILTLIALWCIGCVSKSFFMILEYSIIVFVTQLIFIGCRTWNVKAIAKQDIPQVLISGTFVHLSWLVSIAIGAVSMHEIITKFEWSYLPIIACSLFGGLIGSYLSMKSKRF